jgi:hypothetical protein
MVNVHLFATVFALTDAFNTDFNTLPYQDSAPVPACNFPGRGFGFAGLPSVGSEVFKRLWDVKKAV